MWQRGVAASCGGRSGFSWKCPKKKPTPEQLPPLVGPSGPHGCYCYLAGLARQIAFLHIVFPAVTARYVLLLAGGYLAGGAAVDALALWGEATVAADLLIVAETVPLGNWRFIAILAVTSGPPLIIFTFRG